MERYKCGARVVAATAARFSAAPAFNSPQYRVSNRTDGEEKTMSRVLNHHQEDACRAVAYSSGLWHINQSLHKHTCTHGRTHAPP